MNELDRLLDPVTGYLALGMCEDAWDELENLPSDLKVHDAVLALRIDILLRLEKWESARILAESLAKRCPEKVDWWLHWAYALRREKTLADARAVLMEAATHHPNEALIPYNLACYSCVLGQVGAARKLLEAAFSMDAMLKRVALDDQDLDPIFGENFSEDTPPFVPPHLPE